MKKSAWLLILLLIAISVRPTLGQTTDQSEKKLADIKGEIAALEHQKKTGMYMTGGGLAAELLSIALVPSSSVDPNTLEMSEGSWVPFYLVLGAGTVVGILGVYKWYDAAQQLGPLKAKRYDLGLVPTWDGRRRELGMALVAHF